MRTARAATTAVAAVALAAWTLTTGASYSLVSHFAHIRPVTAVQTDRAQVGVLVDAPANEVPALASLLSTYGIHASFSLGKASSPVEESVFDDGDQAIARLPNSGLVRWLGTRGELKRLIGPMGDRRHFLYASSGPSLGQWLVAHGAGGQLVAGAVRLQDSDDSLGALHPGEVVEFSVASASQLAPLLDKLVNGLDEDHLAAVPVGRLIRDAGKPV